jgi:type IV pilus assembly protein PilA
MKRRVSIMKKFFDKKRKNKGFSLVELIVVVAIMAVLMAVLVPTLVSNVEKSRQQKDKTAIAELRHAIVNALADEACLKATASTTGATASSGVVTIADLFGDTDNDTAIIDKVESIIGAETITLTSKYEASTLKLVEFKPTDGIVVLAVTVTNESDLAFYIDSVGQHMEAWTSGATQAPAGN